MPRFKIALMQLNDNWPHRRVATTSSTSLTSNTQLPSVINQSYLLELDDITLQKAIWSRSKVQGATPVTPFWIGLFVVHGKAWDYSEASPTIKNSPDKPREAQNTGRNPTTSREGSQIYSPSSSETFASPLERPGTKQGERERKDKTLYIYSELVSQNYIDLTPTDQPLTKDKNYRKTYARSNGLEQKGSAMQIQWKLLKSLTARTAELKRLPHT